MGVEESVDIGETTSAEVCNESEEGCLESASARGDSV